MELSWKTCLRAGGTVLVVYLLIHYWSALSGLVGIALGAAYPLFLGSIMAYIVNILMNWYERNLFRRAKKPLARKLKRPVSMVLAFISVVVVVVLVVRMILPELGACIQLLLDKLPGALEKAYLWLDARVDLDVLLQDSGSFFQNGSFDWQGMVAKAVDFLVNGIGGAMDSVVGVVSSVFSTVVAVVVGLVFCIYLLLGKERIGGQLHQLMQTYLHEKLTGKILYVLHAVDQCFHSFIVGQCVEAVILGALCMVGMWLLRLPYASMIGCLVGFTALIPMAGAYIGAAVGAFMIFTVSPIQAVVFLVFLVILQQLEGNLIYPKVVGASIGLPGVWVLAAVTIGGGVLGVGGMLLGVPLAAALYRLLRQDVQKRKPAPPQEALPEEEEK